MIAIELANLLVLAISVGICFVGKLMYDKAVTSIVKGLGVLIFIGGMIRVVVTIGVLILSPLSTTTPTAVQPTAQFVYVPTVQQQNTQTSPPMPTQTEFAYLRITEGTLSGGWKVNNIAWAVQGYDLVDYGRQIEVRMVFSNGDPQGDFEQWSFRRCSEASISQSDVIMDCIHTSKQVKLDFALLVEGKESIPVSLHYGSEQSVTVGSERSLLLGQSNPVIATFQTPQSCMGAEDQKDECMQNKETTITEFSKINVHMGYSCAIIST